MALLVFTDLDGTLLDHETYSWAAAEPALAALRGADIPLVLASSKTGAEIAPLRAALGFAHVPAIVENGAGVLAAGAGADSDAADHTRLLARLNDLTPDLRCLFTGFTDMGPQGIAEATGLPLDQAQLAARRCYSEPGEFSGDAQAEAAFCNALAQHGVHARRGGRFLTLSFGATKADRMAQLRADLGPDAVTMALGDAPNDAEMIAAADFGVIIANPHGAPLPVMAGEATGQITRTQLPGPQGWNQAVLAQVKATDLTAPHPISTGDEQSV